MKTFNIEFGLLENKISVQMKKQGISFDKHYAAKIEKYNLAINALSLARLLSVSEVEKARERLLCKIVRHAESIYNKEKDNEV